MPSFLLKELYMRIDKYISGCGYASRKDVKKLIKQGLVFIDGEVCKKPEEQTDEDSIVEVDGERLIYREFVYLMLNKPQGCVSAVYDKKYPVVTEFVPEEYAHFEVYPVGRLDIDTEGLLILTNDGQFAHELFRTYVLPDEIYPLQFRYKPHSDFPLFQALRFLR